MGLQAHLESVPKAIGIENILGSADDERELTSERLIEDSRTFREYIENGEDPEQFSEFQSDRGYSTVSRIGKKRAVFKHDGVPFDNSVIKFPLTDSRGKDNLREGWTWDAVQNGWDNDDFYAKVYDFDEEQGEFLIMEEAAVYRSFPVEMITELFLESTRGQEAYDRFKDLAKHDDRIVSTEIVYPNVGEIDGQDVIIDYPFLKEPYNQDTRDIGEPYRG